MNHLTDEQWDRLLEVLQGIRDGKTIQWKTTELNGQYEWLDDKPVITDLVRFPLRYRVKPETVTVYVYREYCGDLLLTSNPYASSEPLYTFEHEVQA